MHPSPRICESLPSSRLRMRSGFLNPKPARIPRLLLFLGRFLALPARTGAGTLGVGVQHPPGPWAASPGAGQLLQPCPAGSQGDNLLPQPLNSKVISCL